MSHDSEGHAHHHDENELLAEALESLLVEKGLVETARIDAIVAHYEEDIGPLRGARIVARAWSDPEFKERLLADATTAIGELGIEDSEHKVLVAVENTPEVHNVIVCTLCSCYPWSVLGLPPAWYKDPAYRARVVSEPRAVLREFGLDLPERVEVRVWDSSAEVRYLVVPERPAGTEGLDEDELASHVGRDAMIGTALAGRSQ